MIAQSIKHQWQTVDNDFCKVKSSGLNNVAQRLLAIVVTVISQIAVIMRDGHHADIADSTLYRCVAEVKRLVKIDMAGVLRHSVNQEINEDLQILEDIQNQRNTWWNKAPAEMARCIAGKPALINSGLEIFKKLFVRTELRGSRSHVKAVEQIVDRGIEYSAKDVRLKKKRMNRMKNELAKAAPVENVPRTLNRQVISRSRTTVLRIVALQKSGLAAEVGEMEVYDVIKNCPGKTAAVVSGQKPEPATSDPRVVAEPSTQGKMTLRYMLAGVKNTVENPDSDVYGLNIVFLLSIFRQLGRTSSIPLAVIKHFDKYLQGHQFFRLGLDQKATTPNPFDHDHSLEQI
jgi:hypothetical protein